MLVDVIDILRLTQYFLAVWSLSLPFKRAIEGSVEKHCFINQNTFIEAYSSGDISNPALLFIHGAGSHPLQFKKQLEYFKTDYFVLSIGLHGHSSKFADYSYNLDDFKLSKLADDILYVLSQIGVNKVHLVGNSAGGLTGFEMIKKSPDSVCSIVTFGTCPRLSYPGWMIKMISRTDKWMLEKKPEKYLRFAAKHSTKNKLVRNEIVRLMMESRHIAHLIRANIGNYNYVELLDNLKIQYTIIRGKYDTSINKELNKISRSITTHKNITILDFDKSGHFANLDEPELFNKSILDILQKNKV